MSRIKQHKTIPVFVSHMGCPHDCAFCNQRTITGQQETVTPELADRMISQALSTIPQDSTVEIGFFGGSFTGIDLSLQKGLLSVAKSYVEKGRVHAIRLSTRPDYISEEIVAMLTEYGVTTVELGAQSMDNAVLCANLRGHTKEDTVRASGLIQAAGINLGLQMMTGLKKDTDETCIRTAQEIISLNPACVRIYPTLVLRGTHLAHWYQSGTYIPQTLEDAISICATLKNMFDSADIPIIRMGLMASENINQEAEVVAGPYHPAFGELVQSELYFRALEKSVTTDACIFVHPKTISAFIGNNRRNIEKFLERGYRVQFIGDADIPYGNFQITEQKGGKSCG